MTSKDIKVPLIPECASCMLNSLLTLIPLLSEDKEQQHNLLKRSYEIIEEGYEKRIAPEPLSVDLYQELYSLVGATDPYRGIKERSIAAAEGIMPLVKEEMAKYSGYKRLRTALLIGITGNVIDFNTAGHDPKLEDLAKTLREILEQGLDVDDSKYLWETLQETKGTVLILADNAGETLFDIPLLEVLNELGWSPIYIVKGTPMINDATRDDIKGSRIEELAQVADTGAWAHGVPRRWVSDEFIQLVSRADLVISKGQANIETFPEIQKEFGVETYYITRGKCAHISQAIGAKKGQNVVRKWPATKEQNGGTL